MVRTKPGRSSQRRPLALCVGGLLPALLGGADDTCTPVLNWGWDGRSCEDRRCQHSTVCSASESHGRQPSARKHPRWPCSFLCEDTGAGGVWRTDPARPESTPPLPCGQRTLGKGQRACMRTGLRMARLGEGLIPFFVSQRLPRAAERKAALALSPEPQNRASLRKRPET